MFKFEEKLFEKNKLLSVKDVLFSTSTVCGKIEIVVFVIRSGDVIIYGLPFNQHHPVVRWLPWFDDIKKKICAITIEPSSAEWVVALCVDRSMYVIPILSLLDFKENSPPSEPWLKSYDITKLKNPLIDVEFVPCSLALFARKDCSSSDRYIAIVGSTTGQIIVFTLVSAIVLFTTNIGGRAHAIEVCNKLHQTFIIVTNDEGDQWRILLNGEDDQKDDNGSDISDDQRYNAIELRSITSDTDIKQWKMRFKNRNKKTSNHLSVECGTEEKINCGPQWRYTVTIQNVIECSLNVHINSISAYYPSKVLTIEDFSTYSTSAHMLPEENRLFTVTKSLIIMASAQNSIKIISRHLSLCKDESKDSVLHMEFVESSLLDEYFLEDNERTLKLFCTDFVRDRCIVITNRAFYRIKLKTDSNDLVLRYIIEEENLTLAEKISAMFNIDLQKLICEAGDSQLSKGHVKEAIQLYNLTRCGGTHLILMLAVLGHMPELYDALKTCHYSPAYKLHFMNLKLLVSLHQYMTCYSESLEEELRELLLQSGYDEALAVSVLAQTGLCEELLFLTKMKGLHPITMNIVISILQHYSLINISHCKNFWYLVSDESFCDTLLMKPGFLMFHKKMVQRNLPDLNEDILYKLIKLYNPFNVPLRTWLTELIQTDFPIDEWIQMYILICTYYFAKRKQISIDTIGWVSSGQDWSFINPKIGLFENKISAGFNHAVTTIDGNAYSWGAASLCTLGNGPTTRSVSGPVCIEKFCNIGVKVLSVSCGRNHVLALTENGVYSWGNNKYGQLGQGNIVQAAFPSLIEDLTDYNIIQVAAGQYHSLALDDRQRVFSWGWGVHGQLGHQNIEDCFNPQLISSLSNERVVYCAAGQAHSIFLCENGTIKACGSNAFGQLCNGKAKKSSVPIEIEGINGGIQHISAGYFHNFAVTSLGEMYTWGCSPNVLRTSAHSAKRKMKVSPEEKREIEDTFEYLAPRKIDVSFIKGRIVKVVAGSDHSALLTEEGNIYTWGRNMDGQLGIKAASASERRSQNILIPSPISLGAPVSDIACGYDFTVAIDIGGNVWTWGANYYSAAAKSALSSLEGEIVLVNNKNRVIKLPHSSSNVQPLPTLVKIPITEKLLRKDYKPVLPEVLRTKKWRCQLHYVLETCGKYYKKTEFISQLLSIEEPNVSAKLLQVSGDNSSAFKILLKSAASYPESEASPLIRSIIAYYFSISLQTEQLREFLIDVIFFWIEENLPFPELEEIFYNFWKSVAIPLGDIVFRVNSKHSNLCSLFSSKFKLRLVEYMVTHKSSNIECVFEGCTNIKEVIAALGKANDYVDVTIEAGDSSKKTIVFKGPLRCSEDSDVL